MPVTIVRAVMHLAHIPQMVDQHTALRTGDHLLQAVLPGSHHQVAWERTGVIAVAQGGKGMPAGCASIPAGGRRIVYHTGGLTMVNYINNLFGISFPVKRNSIQVFIQTIIPDGYFLIQEALPPAVCHERLAALHGTGMQPHPGEVIQQQPDRIGRQDHGILTRFDSLLVFIADGDGKGLTGHFFGVELRQVAPVPCGIAGAKPGHARAVDHSQGMAAGFQLVGALSRGW